MNSKQFLKETDKQSKLVKQLLKEMKETRSLGRRYSIICDIEEAVGEMSALIVEYRFGK